MPTFRAPSLDENHKIRGKHLPTHLQETELSATYVPKTVQGRVVALGTSIAAAQGASAATVGYPERITARLNEWTGQVLYQVVRAGVAGNTTEQMLARLPDLLTTHKPEYVTIEASVNDARADLNVSTATTIANLTSMIDLARAAGAIPIIITAAPIDPVWYNSPSYTVASAAKVVTTNASVRSLATSKRVLMVDMYKVLLDKVGILVDGIHPNDTGHDLWGQAIAQVILKQIVTNKQTIIASDSFNRANDPAALGTAEIGGAWTSIVGTWGIENNQAYSPPDSSLGLAALDAGTTDAVAKTVLGSTFGVGLALRVLDSSRYYLAEISDNRVVTIYKRVAGAYTSLGTYTVPAKNVGDTFAFSIDGTHLSVWHNDVMILGATDTAITTSTKAGIWNAGTAAGVVNSARFESFVLTK